MIRKVHELFGKLRDCVEGNDSKGLVQYCISQKHKFYCPIIFSKPQKATLEKFVETNNIQSLELQRFIDNKYVSTDAINEDYESICSIYSQMNGFEDIKEILDNAVNRMIDLRNRLEQDCYKIIYNFKNSYLQYLQVDNIIFLPNPDKIHSELNVREKLISEGLYPHYIGIFKLSCLVCDIVISGDEESNKTIIHAGGHGIAYPFDKLPTSVIEDEKMILLYNLLDSTRVLLPIDTTRQSYEIDSARQYASFSPKNELVSRVYTPAEAASLVLEFQKAIFYRGFDEELLDYEELAAAESMFYGGVSCLE